MIRNKLSELLGRNRMSVRELAKRAGISYTAAYRLYTESTHRYDGETLDGICSALGCQPGDLLEYIPDEESASAGEELDDERLKEAIAALEKEGVPVFRSEEDVERVVRERAPKAMEDFKAGRVKTTAQIEEELKRGSK